MEEKLNICHKLQLARFNTEVIEKTGLPDVQTFLYCQYTIHFQTENISAKKITIFIKKFSTSVSAVRSCLV